MKYSVAISKPIYRYYNYIIEADNEMDAVEKTKALLDRNEIKDDQLQFAQDEDDYSIEDSPADFTVVDAIEYLREEIQ